MTLPTQTFLPKFKNITTEWYVIPVAQIRVYATPICTDLTLPPGQYNPAPYVLAPEIPVMVDTLPEFYLDQSAGGAMVSGAPTEASVKAFIAAKAAADSGDGEGHPNGYYYKYFSSYKNFGVNTFREISRPSFQTDGTGWTATFEVEGGTEVNHTIFQPGRGLAVWITQWIDGTDSAPVFNGHAITVYVNEQGGQEIINSPAGRSILKINASTLHKFMDKPVRKLPYFSFEQAKAERARWGVDENGTTVPPSTSGDPFRGFGAIIDTYGIAVGGDVTIPRANSKHIISYLTVTKLVEEVLGNHLRVSKNNNPFVPFASSYQLSIDKNKDVEDPANLYASTAYSGENGDIAPNGLMWLDKEDGNLMGSIQEVARHGAWRTWMDSLNHFHMEKDYAARYSDYLQPVVIFKPGRSVQGELTVRPGRKGIRIARVEVSGNPQTAPAGSLTALQFYLTYGQGLFPKIALNAIQGGSVYPFTGYHGSQVHYQARATWAQMSAETTAQQNSYPFANVFALFQKVVSIEGKDPQGLYDYSAGAMSEMAKWSGAGMSDVFAGGFVPQPPGYDDGLHYDGFGKRFVVESISVSFSDWSQDTPNVGYMESSISMKEIIFFPVVGDNQTPGYGATAF